MIYVFFSFLFFRILCVASLYSAPSIRMLKYKLKNPTKIFVQFFEFFISIKKNKSTTKQQLNNNKTTIKQHQNNNKTTTKTQQKQNTQSKQNTTKQNCCDFVVNHT